MIVADFGQEVTITFTKNNTVGVMPADVAKALGQALIEAAAVAEKNEPRYRGMKANLVVVDDPLS